MSKWITRLIVADYISNIVSMKEESNAYKLLK
jgi:hypothetical protein